MSRSTGLTLVLVLLLAGPPAGGAYGQVIDFETLPGGEATVDIQEISTQYAVFGVTFTLLSRETGLPIGFPRIAKAGAPRTAFNGCYDYDTPLPHLDLGVSFLTDGTEVEIEGDLLIEYAVPVAQASGVILDIDCRTGGLPPCEQWTVTAYDEFGEPVAQTVLDGPTGVPDPDCMYDSGPGDAEAFGWALSTSTAQIKSIILRYTGEATGVGLAFDNFSVAGEPPAPTASVASSAETVCPFEVVRLTASVSGGMPPYALQWQKETTPGYWSDLGTDWSQEVLAVATARYRVVATDTWLGEAISAPVQITVAAEDEPLCQAGLLVSNYKGDRVVRYSLLSHQAQVFVSQGSGGLNGPSKAICGPDGNFYVTSQDDDRVLRYDGATGEFLDVFVAQGSGGLNIPIGLDFGPDGNLYVASYYTSSVLRYDQADGAFIDAFVPTGSGLNGPSGLIFGTDGDLYVCSLDGDKVLRFDGATGDPLGDFVTAGSGGLDAPRGLVFGADGNLYVSEQYNDSVRRFDGATGEFIDVFVTAGSGGLDRANDLAFGLDGALYVVSYDNDKFLRFDGGDGSFLGELPDDLLNGPNWVTVGCAPLPASHVPDVPPSGMELVVEPGVPNPFNPRTTVAFTLDVPGPVRVLVFDVSGRLIANLRDEEFAAGRHEVEWDGRTDTGRPAPSGVYFFSVKSGPASGCAKGMLVR